MPKGYVLQITDFYSTKKGLVTIFKLSLHSMFYDYKAEKYESTRFITQDVINPRKKCVQNTETSFAEFDNPYMFLPLHTATKSFDFSAQSYEEKSWYYFSLEIQIGGGAAADTSFRIPAVPHSSNKEEAYVKTEYGIVVYRLYEPTITLLSEMDNQVQLILFQLDSLQFNSNDNAKDFLSRRLLCRLMKGNHKAFQWGNYETEFAQYSQARINTANPTIIHPYDFVGMAAINNQQEENLSFEIFQSGLGLSSITYSLEKDLNTVTGKSNMFDRRRIQSDLVYKLYAVKIP